ncbi:Rap1a/Tai family immunity protein [Devosia faecipullorum]|uniref:Rap1a/Tai family immunity protein n=1 Tax=Devosia faecipullorum TaxID=2755039 RepID=UPI00187B8999|nr:Rap1a/Tai family immunity protein [Devosia faecipullorum]MBE7731799.1 hypothetical protein [Devosia faecipullorum]
MIRAMLAIAILTLTTTVAWSAGFLKGSDLHALCQSASTLDKQSCMAYILGALDTMGNTGTAPCNVSDVSGTEFIDVVKAYLQNNPASLVYEAPMSIHLAYDNQFCP